MTFEITERLVQDVAYYYAGMTIPSQSYTTHYDVVRSNDRKVIKSFTDLLEALYYKNELEKLSGTNPNT